METYKTTQEQKLENARKHVKRIKGFSTRTLCVFVLVNVFIIFSNVIADGKGFNNMDNYYTAFFSGFRLIGSAVYRFLVVSCF